MHKRLLLPLLAACTFAAAQQPAGGVVAWIALGDPRLEIRGLPWLAENSPELWRLPQSAKAAAPKGVWARAVAPDGGRIRIACDTSRILLRVKAGSKSGKPCHFDAYLGDQFAGSARADGSADQELSLLTLPDRAMRQITIYLPNNHEAHVLAVGVDPGSRFGSPAPFAAAKPLVCYGSSVLQGTGSDHPGMTYPAALARRLNLDFVNLGFGGAGKAEPQVVALVNQLEACGYLFDLGKSYGFQPADPYLAMLKAIRAAHPAAPIFCVTPIYSTKEAADPEYLKRSEDLRTLMRGAADQLRQAGDAWIFTLEGLVLFGPADADLFHDPLHPNDQGNARIAQRLEPILRPVLLAP